MTANPPRCRGLLAAIFCAGLAGQMHMAWAADGDSTLAERYEHARQSLEEQRAAEAQTRDERDRLSHEAEDLRNRLVANAAKVQEYETAFATTSAEISRLGGQEKQFSSDLLRDRDRVTRLLAVLQRLDADTPPALAMRPEDSLAAARGAMMLGAMLPPVYHEARDLGARLRALADTRRALQAKNSEARTEAKALSDARIELALLLEGRSQAAALADAKLAELHGVTEEIARETGDLKSLIDRIASLRAQAAPSEGMVVVTPARGGPDVLKRGALLRPVTGTMVAGDPAGPGQTPGKAGTEGLWFETGGLAQAVAPADSEVVFAGAYQKFGQVLILELAGGYHLLLAGLGRIDVHIGDLVLAGEPVGVLPEGKTTRLYLELRRNGQTVDPAPWIGPELRKVRG